MIDKPSTTGVMIDIDGLKKLAIAATPGPWEWWTSNSVLRLTGADGKDGGVICATMHANWPDIMCSRENQAYLAAANPQAVLALLARIKELENLCAILALPRGNGNE